MISVDQMLVMTPLYQLYNVLVMRLICNFSELFRKINRVRVTDCSHLQL